MQHRSTTSDTRIQPEQDCRGDERGAVDRARGSAGREAEQLAAESAVHQVHDRSLAGRTGRSLRPALTHPLGRTPAVAIVWRRRSRPRRTWSGIASLDATTCTSQSQSCDCTRSNNRSSVTRSSSAATIVHLRSPAIHQHRRSACEDDPAARKPGRERGIRPSDEPVRRSMYSGSDKDQQPSAICAISPASRAAPSSVAQQSRHGADSRASYPHAQRCGDHLDRSREARSCQSSFPILIFRSASMTRLRKRHRHDHGPGTVKL